MSRLDDRLARLPYTFQSQQPLHGPLHPTGYCLASDLCRCGQNSLIFEDAKSTRLFMSTLHSMCVYFRVQANVSSTLCYDKEVNNLERVTHYLVVLDQDKKWLHTPPSTPHTLPLYTSHPSLLTPHTPPSLHPLHPSLPTPHTSHRSLLTCI